MDSMNRIFQIVEYMNLHIDDDLLVEKYCEISSYSKSHLYYLFNLYLGETPQKYFYKLKLKHGADLLYDNVNVLDIALAIGFNSHEAFSRAFKKEFGVTPNEYRGLYIRGLHRLSELNDIELTFIYMPSPAFRLFLGLDKYGNHYDIYQSLVNKGYLDPHNNEYTIDGKQVADKYLWDCSKIIVELSKTYNTLQELYENTVRLIHIPKILFFKFAYDLVDTGRIKNVFIARCGCNCFKCDTLIATLNDDDEIRKSQSIKYKNEFNVDLTYSKINCLGCTSDTLLESCNTNCPWTPCCKIHSVNRCNLCIQYPCNEIGEMFKHLPDFKDNLLNL